MKFGSMGEMPPSTRVRRGFSARMAAQGIEVAPEAWFTVLFPHTPPLADTRSDLNANSVVLRRFSMSATYTLSLAMIFRIRNSSRPFRIDANFS